MSDNFEGMLISQIPVLGVIPKEQLSWLVSKLRASLFCNCPHTCEFYESRQELNCPICLETKADRVRLGCSHIICLSCSLDLMESGSSTCPTCRASISELKIIDLLGRGHNSILNEDTIVNPPTRRYEVEAILGTTNPRGGRDALYIIKWSNGEITREPRANLIGCSDIWREYQRRRHRENVRRSRIKAQLRRSARRIPRFRRLIDQANGNGSDNHSDPDYLPGGSRNNSRLQRQFEIIRLDD